MSEFDVPVGGEAREGTSRRTVTKAMAWAVPVIAVSAAVPAFAASQILINLNGNGCKLPGNSTSTYKGYAFALSINNESTVPITINIVSITLNGESLGPTALVDVSGEGPLAADANPFVLAPGADLLDAALLTSNAANSSNGTLTITYTINGGSQVTVSATVDAAPPVVGASCTAFDPVEKVRLAGVIGGVPEWEPTTTYAVADTVQLSTGVFLSATVAGLSGATEPVAPAPGGTVVDGTVTWQRPLI